MRGVSVIFPCLNEACALPDVLRDAKAALAQCGFPVEIIVADNGSTDGSPWIAAMSGAKVIDAPVLGYGAALHAGISQAQYEYIVFADADGSYPMESLSKLIEPLQQGKADLALASRIKGTIEPGASPFINRFLGTPALSWLLRFLYRIPVSDCNSGMRAVTAEAYGKMEMSAPGMEYSSEMLVKAARQGMRYVEIPIPFYRTKPGRRSHLRPWRDGWRHLTLIIRNAFC